LRKVDYLLSNALGHGVSNNKKLKIKEMQFKEYYSLKELEDVVDIKKRQLKYRMIKVKKKYAGNNKKLYRGKKQWNIHKSILFEFERKKISKEARIYKSNTLVTIQPDGNYDVAYNYQLLVDLIKDLSEATGIPITCNYYIEQGERGQKFHTHFTTNLTDKFSRLIFRHANFYTRCNVDVRPIHEEWQLLDYLQKEIVAQGTIPCENSSWKC